MIDLPQPEGFVTRCYRSVTEIDPAAWNGCVGPDHPLLWHQHFLSLENAGIAAPSNGFTPRYIVTLNLQQELVGIAPCFIKSHSQGEFGADLGLQMAYERELTEYFPKVYVGVPMNPWVGPRLLIHGQSQQLLVARALVDGIEHLAAAERASSIHFNAISAASEAKLLADQGYSIAESTTYAWRASDVKDFDGFTGRMRKSYRGAIKRQRRLLANQNLSYLTFTGQALNASIAAQFFKFYVENFVRHQSRPDLNEAYFLEVVARMPEAVEISVATKSDDWLGALFSIKGKSKTFVMHWGQNDAPDFLHFEVCYYRIIENAIGSDTTYLNFSSSGEHKLARGLKLEPVYNAFKFSNPAFNPILNAACSKKTQSSRALMYQQALRSPFDQERFNAEIYLKPDLSP